MRQKNTCAPARHWHFNPRTPCGVRRAQIACGGRFIAISIHAPRAGCDTPPPPLCRCLRISIHAPRAGCDQAVFAPKLNRWRFQSTHPVRGATGNVHVIVRQLAISIHAPRAGCDAVFALLSILGVVFQSTHPVRGATEAHEQAELIRKFQSTHPVRGATDSLLVDGYTKPFQSTHPVRGATAGFVILW